MISTTEDCQKNSVLCKKLFYVTKTFTFRNSFCHIRLIMMFTASPGCRNQQTKVMKIPKTVSISSITSTSHQDLMEHLELSDENFFNATNLNRLFVHLFKILSPQLKDQVDSDFFLITLCCYICLIKISRRTSLLIKSH